MRCCSSTEVRGWDESISNVLSLSCTLLSRLNADCWHSDRRKSTISSKSSGCTALANRASGSLKAHSIRSSFML